MSETAAPAITPSTISSGPSESQLSEWFGLDTAPDAPADDTASEPADASTTQEAETPTVPDEGATTESTEGEPTPPESTTPEARKSLPFTIIGADGKPLDAAQLDGLKIEVKGAGKKDTLTLADVVRRASSEAGAVRHAHRVEGQLTEAQKLHEQLRAEHNALAEERQTLRTIARRAALDDDFREQLRAELEEYESPESELARLKDEKARETQTRAQQEQAQRHVQTATRFFDGTVVPAFDAILKNNPSLSFEEVLGRFHTETSALSENGVIPPKHYAKVDELLKGSLAKWATSRHGERAKLGDEARKERANAQQAKNKLARAVAPNQGGTGSSSAAPTPNGTGKPLSYKDAQKHAFAAFLSE